MFLPCAASSEGDWKGGFLSLPGAPSSETSASFLPRGICPSSFAGFVWPCRRETKQYSPTFCVMPSDSRLTKTFLTKFQAVPYALFSIFRQSLQMVARGKSVWFWSGETMNLLWMWGIHNCCLKTVYFSKQTPFELVHPSPPLLLKYHLLGFQPYKGFIWSIICCLNCCCLLIMIAFELLWRANTDLAKGTQWQCHDMAFSLKVENQIESREPWSKKQQKGLSSPPDWAGWCGIASLHWVAQSGFWVE